jgi:hypothetical protein
MPASSPAERSLIAGIASHVSWANTGDRTARTAPARAAMQLRFERQVDPDGTLPPDERAKRAEHARKAYFMQLARKSADVRRRNADATELRTIAAEATAAAEQLEAADGTP